VVDYGAAVLVGTKSTSMDEGDLTENMTVTLVTFAALKFHAKVLCPHERLGDKVGIIPIGLVGGVGTVVVVVVVVSGLGVFGHETN
jgi:hypothetical protein